MATPNIELTVLINRFADTIRATVESIRDEIITGRGTGVPDEVTIQRLTEQRQAGISAVDGKFKQMVNQTVGRARQTYVTAVSELMAALEVPETLPFTLPQEAGYRITLDELGNKVANLGDAAGSARLRAQAIRQARFLDTDTSVQVQSAQQERDLVPMIWVAAFKNTCADCLLLAGQIKTLGEWKQSGFMPGNGNTKCKENCMCHLVPATVLIKRFRLQEDENPEATLQTMLENGVKLQQKKIEELEKLRGQKYAPSTRLAMLGQVRSLRFNPNFTEKEAVFLTKVTDKNPSLLSFKKRQRLKNL